MAPNYDASAAFALPVYLGADSQTIPSYRTDSPLSSSSLATSDSEMRSGDNTQSTSSSRTSPDEQPKGQAPRQRRPPAPKSNKQGKENGGSTALRFFVVDHPTKLKDKSQMRENRKHVMHDYLDKERRKPMSSDIRVTGTSTAAKKRKRVEKVPPTSNNLNAPSAIFNHSQSPPSTTQGLVAERSSSERDEANPIAPPTVDFRELNGKASRSKVTPRQIRFADDEAPLVRGIAGGFNNSRYLRASPESIPHLSAPDPTSYLGSNLQPFDSWPALTDPALNVEELKWSCSRKFGSHGIAKSWVPTLLKARHAFLSTICISASHDDIMKRGLQTPQERAPFGSEERMKVRSEVLTLVNQALQDPQTQTTDATLVAVLHVLNSEIMGCDDAVMRIHQDGLHNLVRQRGGLDRLGIDGHLASILTITMYMISALRETEPHEDFIKYGSSKRTKPPNNQNQLPESPVYCRASGFLTIKRAIADTSPTYLLLEDLRQLTHSFVRGTGSHFVTPLTPVNMRAMWDQNPNTVSSLKDKIFKLPPCEDIADSFDNMSDKYTYESLRMVALVYAHALANEVPLSKAASQLAATNSHTRTSSLPVYPATDSTQQSGTGTSWHLIIKSALIRTNLSDCWSHMAGVLFWMSLIAGACANPDSPSNKPRRELSPEEEEGRKWLAAIAVRCSIVLSFEYGGAILESLKRMVGIEQALAKADAERGALEEWFNREDVVYGPTMDGTEEVGTETFGPAEQTFVQRTFADFAQDFMSDFV